MRMSGLDLQTCTAGRWHGAPPVMLTGVTTDTRRLNPGDAFVALSGPNFDGHAFAAEA
ncbi:MAG TPA: UDP-N-acetylmuramoyl-tripeptide--D-alanyl-D-alanine ligase, partial [Zetaproteobacteria bacterium]|nr:UDP-N-acetylmuramoyl-tripeptide--D-alanyl-D-alanine ligase [Zetaproteobacteria bacterium]